MGRCRLGCTVLVMGARRWSAGFVAVVLALSGCAAAHDTDPAPIAPVHGLVQRLTVCPDSPAPPQVSALPGARGALLPFVPRRFLLCRYGGLNSGRSQVLVQHDRVVTSSAVARLTAVLRHGDPTRSGTEGIVCPADFATVTTVYAEDGSHGGWLILHADRTGCPTIRNGYVDARIGDALAAQLDHLVGAPGM